MPTPDWLEPLLSAAALAGVATTVILGVLGWRWQRRELAGIRSELGGLSHLRTSAEQRRSEVAAEALGATIRYGVVLKRAGEAPAERGALVYLREALEKTWSDIAPVERRFEEAWDQALVYLPDERVSDLMERLWRLKETRHKEQQANLTGEAAVDAGDDGEGKSGSGSPGLLGGPEFERYIQFVEAVDDLVREAKEIIRPLVR
jgi:hypothetical protein